MSREKQAVRKFPHRLYHLFFVLVENLHSLLRHIAVQLGNHFNGSVHGEHRDASVQGQDISVGHILRHSTAAAGIYLAKFAHLPYHVSGFAQAANLGNKFCWSVRRTGFAAGTGVFHKAYAAVEMGVVGFVTYVWISGVESVGYIGGKALGIFEAFPEFNILSVAEAVHKIFKGLGFHTGNAHRTNFLFIG